MPLSDTDLQSLVTQVTQDAPFVERDGEYESMRLLIYQNRRVTIPGVNLKTQFRDPALEDACHAFKNRMLAAPVKINVAARSQSPRAVDKARTLEAFYYRYYERWRAAGVFDPMLFDQAGFGIGWGYLTLNWELLPDLADMEDGEQPDAYFARVKPEIEAFMEEEQTDFFQYEHVAASTMYWTPGRDIIIHKSKVPYNQLREEAAARGKAIDIDRNGKVEIQSIAPATNYNYTLVPWGKQVELYIVSDDDMIYQCLRSVEGKREDLTVFDRKPNIFERPAFFPTEGELTGDSHPLYATRPLVQGLYQTVPYRNIAMNAKLSAGVDTAQQRYALKKINPDIPDASDGALEIRVVDNVLLPPDGYEIVQPGIATGPDLRDAIELISAEQSKYGMPRILGKQQEEVTASSGYQQAQQQDIVQSLLDPPLGHFAAMLQSQLFPAMAAGVRNLGIDMTVVNIKQQQTAGRPQNVQDSVTIRPDDIIDVDVSVTFNATTIFSRTAMEEEGMKMMAQDLMHPTEFLQDIRGVVDTEAWYKQLGQDKMRKYASELAITDARAAIDQLRAQFTQQGVQQAGVSPLITNTDAGRPDRGPSMPIGPGAAMPITPTPPGMGGMPPPAPGAPGMPQIGPQGMPQ